MKIKAVQKILEDKQIERRCKEKVNVKINEGQH